MKELLKSRKGIASSTIQLIVLLVLGVLFVALIMTVLSDKVPAYFGEMTGIADNFIEANS